MINENVPLALIHVIANISHLLPFRIVRADRNLTNVRMLTYENNISLKLVECPVRTVSASLVNSSLIEITMRGENLRQLIKFTNNITDIKKQLIIYLI